jgi:hypothetical protein
VQHNWIVITSIYSPREDLINSFPDDWSVVVVGDLKTPHESWKSVSRHNFFYLSPDEQKDLFPEFSLILGFGTYARKNIGYLFAIMNGATSIWDTDDDTYIRSAAQPYLNNLNLAPKSSLTGEGFFNPYSFFAKNSGLWPRGYPLRKVAVDRWVQSNEIKVSAPTEAPSFDILQTLVNIEPDLDAIYRMTVGDAALDFPFSNEILVCGDNVISPGNTQSTFWVNREVYHFLYIPRWVTFRFCDILKMYIAQFNARLGYAGFWSEQYRNPHDYMVDFESEVQCFLNTEKVVEHLSLYQSNSLATIYQNLFDIGVCVEKDVEAATIFETLVNELRK